MKNRKKYVLYVDGFKWGTFDTKAKAEAADKREGKPAFPNSVMASWIEEQ